MLTMSDEVLFSFYITLPDQFCENVLKNNRF